VLVSGSRAAFLASCLGFLFLAWSWRGAPRFYKLSSVLLLAFLVTGAFRLAPPRARQRIAALPQEVTQGTLHGRTQIWKAGAAVFRARPVRGVGAGAFPEAVRPRLGVPGRPGHRYVAHNSYLSVLVEYGLVGFALFALAAGLLVVFVALMPPLERGLWLVMLLVCGTGMLTLSWEHRKPVWMIAAWIMSGWWISFARREERP
jgi:O-antigen ligase